MGAIAKTGLGEIITTHVSSLPVWETGRATDRSWPWFLLYLGVPAVGASAIWATGFAPSQAAVAALLAGVGVMGALLFQVLAWVSTRLGTLADGIEGRNPTRSEFALIERLDIARANLAYGSITSVVFVVLLGTGALMQQPPEWVVTASAFLLFHLGLTLLLIIVRISDIGRDDRVAALTAKARAQSDRR